MHPTGYMAEGGYAYQWHGYPNGPGYAPGYGHGGMVQAAYGVPGYQQVHQPGAPPWPPQHQQQQYTRQAHAAHHHHQQQQQHHAMMSQHMQQPTYAPQYPQPQYPPQQGVSYQQHPVPPPVPPPPPSGRRRSSSQGGSQAGVGNTPGPPEPAGGQNQEGTNPARATQQQQRKQQHGEPARQPYTPAIDTAAAAAAGQTGAGSAASTPGANSGSVLLAALHNHTSQRGHAAGSSAAAAVAAPALGSRAPEPAGGTAAALQGAGGGRAAGPSSGGVGSAGASSSGSAQLMGRVDPMGVYLQGVPTDATSEQLQDLISEQYGRVANVQIIGVKGHVTKCAFVNFAEEASAQKLLAVKVIKVNTTAVHVLPKIVKVKTAAGEASSSGQAAGQQGASSSSAAGTSKQAPQQQQSKSLGVNEEGLPMVRGVVCCPFFMGTGKCAFKSGCKYHHPMHAMHPACLLQGKKPQRYDYIIPPSYARLVNFTERLWDYDSCAEAQLKIWLARHLLASECSGCGMFDESAAVPAADEDAAFPDESQPLRPYTCTMDEADQVLQLLWKAQPDEAAKQSFPYKGKLRLLLADDPYYEIAPDPLSPGRLWVKLLVGTIKGLLNY